MSARSQQTMESAMFRSVKVPRTFIAAVALATATGCAQPEKAAAPAPGAEQAGAWYQIYFEAGGFQIKDKAQSIVRSVAHLVATEGPSRVTVIGKTDRIGAAPANMALSRRRAGAVRDALIAVGVPTSSILTRWTGERKPHMATADQVDEQGNRVVDITVLKLSR
jgi:peptidoglycan-associated lipoprotein